MDLHNALMVIATDKVIKEKMGKTAREELTVGDHDVDFNVHIRGRIRVGEDYERIPTVNIPLIDALILFAHNAGVTRKATCDALAKAMRQALEGGEDAKRVIASMQKTVSDAAERVRETLDSLPAVTVKGAVTTKLSADYTPTGQREPLGLTELAA